jgi:hypothetical protein
LTGETVLGLVLLVKNFVDPKRVITKLMVHQFVASPFRKHTAYNNLPWTTVQAVMQWHVAFSVRILDWRTCSLSSFLFTFAQF